MKKALFYGILASFFFAFTFLLNRSMHLENCLIEDKKSQEIIRTIRGLLKSFKIKTYNEDTGYGLHACVIFLPFLSLLRYWQFQEKSKRQGLFHIPGQK